MRGFRSVALFPGMVLVGTAMAGMAHAAAAESREAQLASRDRQAIAGIVCTPAGSAGIESATGLRAGRGNGKGVLSIRCLPHGSEAAVPVARVAMCSRDKGTWNCIDARDALLMKLPNGSPLALVADGVPAREAMKTVFEAASMTVPPFHSAAAAILQDRCTLRQGDNKAFKGAVHFDVQCTRGTLAITRDCWNGRCRFFVTGGSQRG